MSTRCTVTVRDRKDGNHAFTIYRHSDGYPDTPHGVLATLKGALSYAFPLPRFEEDDFAAAIVAAWKTPGKMSGTYCYQGGDIRLMESRDSCGDSEYHYEIFPDGKGRVCVETLRRNDETDQWEPHGAPRFLTAKMQAPVDD